MKKRFYITESYCAGNLATAYSVGTEAEAKQILKEYQQVDEFGSYMTIEEQVKPWYSTKWRTIRLVAEWYN